MDRNRIMTVATIKEYIEEYTTPLEVERVSLMDSLGRRAAETIYATYDEPPFSKAAVDGFACHELGLDTAEGHTVYHLVGTIGAGVVWPNPLQPGEALQLMTGAPVPANTYGVVMQELCTIEGDRVCIKGVVEAGRHSIEKGVDGYKGQVLIDAGHMIGEGAVGLLASQGVENLLVYRKPRVALITSGEEVQELGRSLGEGRIYNSNAYLLRALLESHGGEVVHIYHMSDDVTLLEGYIQAMKDWLSTVDVVISTGGVSVGQFDTLPYVYEQLGYTTLFNRLRMRPGGACYGGTQILEETGRRVWAIGLSGNPQAAYNQFYLVVKPLLEMLQGGSLESTVLEAYLDEDISTRPGLERYVHGYIRYDRGCMYFQAVPKEASHGVKNLAMVQAIGRLKELDRGRRGELIEVLMVT